MRRGCLVLWLVAAACSGGDDVPSPDGRTGDPALQIGVFEVELTAPAGAEPGRTSVIGTIYDAGQPDTVVWEVAAEDGACRLLTPRVPFCATPCGSAAACVEDDVCQAYATKQSVGAIHVTGISVTGGGAEFTMEPVVNSYQPPAGVTPAFPPFAAGTAVRFAAAGSAWNGAFTIDAVGVDALALTSADPALARDEAVALAWAAGTVAAATIAVKLDISHHGGTRGKIECSGPDNGAMTIGGALITGLLDLGASGFPTIIVSRSLTGATVIGAGRVDLDVRSEVERPVVVPGVQSCDDDEDCDEPETCRDDLTCG
jgi:hypothetical protein